MKSFKRIIAVLLAVITLSACLSACGNSADVNTPTGAASTAEVTVKPAETADPDFVCDLPADLNFKNHPDNTIRMMVDAFRYSADEMYADEDTGDIISSAVYRRNLIVEDALGITLEITRATSTSDTEVAKAISKAVSDGASVYDLCTIPGYRATGYLKGNFHNLIGVENLNLKKHYWTQGFNEIMSFKGKQFLASGAYSLAMIRGMYVTAFNKDLIDSFHLENPYELVAKNEWTFEKHAQMIRDAYVDDGNNERDAADVYGFIGSSYSPSDPYWVSFNMEFLTKSGDEYAIDVDEEKFVNVVSMVHGLLFENSGAFCISTGSSTSDGTTTSVAIGNAFRDNKAATAVTEISIIEQQVVKGGFEGKYGIVPVPKYNADQEKYLTHTSDRLTTMAIVSTVPAENLPMIGAVMEKISAESYDKVFPEYYENALSFRYLQDADSKKMLDTIYNGIKIEGAFLYAGNFSMLSGFRSLFTSGEVAASTIKANHTAWNAAVKQLNKVIEKY